MVRNWSLELLVLLGYFNDCQSHRGCYNPVLVPVLMPNTSPTPATSTYGCIWPIFLLLTYIYISELDIVPLCIMTQLSTSCMCVILSVCYDDTDAVKCHLISCRILFYGITSAVNTVIGALLLFINTIIMFDNLNLIKIKICYKVIKVNAVM